jgi:Ser/Thr protein kinase RdoA (MazF antagonist)
MIIIPKPGKMLSELFKKREMIKTDLNSNQIRSVLNNYDLDSWRISKILGGGNSDNILLETSKGFKVLKKYYWSIDSTLQEHSILKHLKKNKFISPRLENNKQGLTYTEINNNHYAIYDYIKGYNFEEFFISFKNRKKFVEQAAIILARFHRIMLNFVPEGRKFNGYMPGGKQLYRDIDWHLNVINKYVKNIKKRNKKNKLEQFMLNVKNKISQGLIETGKYFQIEEPKFIRLVTHGDYSPKNVLFIRNKLITILDFGDANLNLRIMDVARGLSSFSVNRKFGIDYRLSNIFLNTYMKHYPLSNYEIEAIPDLIKWRYLMNIIWKIFHMADYPENREGIENSFKFIQKKWAGILWIDKHSPILKKELMGLVFK